MNKENPCEKSQIKMVLKITPGENSFHLVLSALPTLYRIEIAVMNKKKIIIHSRIQTVQISTDDRMKSVS